MRGMGWAGSLALVLVASVVSPVRAAWVNEYTVAGLGALTVRATAFQVAVEGSDPVCSMTFGDQVDQAAPWSFTFDLESDNQAVSVELCDGSYDLVYVQTVVPWRIYGDLLSLDEAVKGVVNVTLESVVEQPASVRIVDGKGKVLGRGAVEAGVVSTVSFKPSSTAVVARYSAIVTGSVTGDEMTLPIVVTNKWRTDSGRTYDKCATITWWYDHSRAPKTASASRVRADIVGALKIISAETGLRYVQVQSAAQLPEINTLVVDWDPKVTSAAEGGFRTSVKSDGTSDVEGEVSLNPRSNWVAKDSTRGFKFVKSARVTGTGWLMVHEVMHTLGLDHTSDRTQVMYPYLSKQVALGAGDKAGLRHLYEPSGCQG